MHVNVIIPTCTEDRLKLLGQTITTLKASTHKDLGIFVIIDGNPKLIPKISQMDVAMIVNEKRRDWVFSMNKAMNIAIADAIVYASDDLIFEKNCLLHAVKTMKARAPDGDALVAIEQDVKGCTTAFGMMGRKFIERFPNRQVFCPDYIHYGGDAELGRFARRIGKLIPCGEAKVIHRRDKDDTYRLAKPVEFQDIKLVRKRIDKGLVWGLNFERLRP